jgi:hypothetical protein
MGKVNWIGDAGDGLSRELTQRLDDELRAVFCADDEDDDGVKINATRQFRGFSWNPSDKVVLGIEVRHKHGYHTHVVKLGKRTEVAHDYEGWKECIRGQNFASRILVRLRIHDLPGDRVAVVYQDAYSLFGDGPQLLEDAVTWSVTDRKPDPSSVERALYQIFTDLNRWCYRHAVEDRSGAALEFYRQRLERAIDSWAANSDMPVVERRDAESRWRIRRDAAWLLRGGDPPDPSERMSYLDAVDFVRWAMQTGNIPGTLVGKAHGDLHGRNVLVGVERGQVDYPAVFDYGEMGESNVICWDFVKLETELKVRLLPKLFNDESARRALVAAVDAPSPDGTCHESIARKNRLQFAFALETRLDDLTARILSEDHAESVSSLPADLLTGHAAVDRALAIVLRVRKEAALWLGFRRQRNVAWRDEYYFALAVYGLCNPKWNYTELETECAVVSAGVAAARVQIAEYETERLLSSIGPPPAPYPSYRVPLIWAYQRWKAGDSESGVDLLARACRESTHSVPLKQTYALLLSEEGRHEEAMAELRDLRRLSVVFQDEEALARLGRIAKDWADRELDQELRRAPVELRAIQEKARPAWQFYNVALDCYRQAFAVSNHVYSGANAATLAYLVGSKESAQQFAQQVAEIARTAPVDCWTSASEGEACLLLHDVDGAVSHYSSALARTAAEEKQLAQSMYRQVSRLWWALGAERVNRVVEVFRQWESEKKITLEPGPAGDCGRSIQFPADTTERE